jgi:VWFA-related protein
VRAASLVGHVALATLATSALWAQARDPIRVATRLVQVHVVVQDGDRNPVSGLTRQDFRLLDDGKEQVIELFEVESVASTADSPPVPPAPPDTFTNELRATGGGVTVILIDRLNTSIVDQLAVRNQAVTFLEQIQPGDRVGLYMLDNADSIHVLHDFTGDARSLIRVLARMKGRTSNEVAAAEDVVDTSFTDSVINPDLLAWAQAVETDRKVDVVRDRVRHTNVGLETIARRLAGVRGRKNLLWISSAFPISVSRSTGTLTSMGPDLNSGLLALNDANVAVYPIDARRLIGAFSSPAAARNQTFTTLATVRDSTDALELVAAETGGRAFFNTNDITGAMRRAMNDGRVTYVLGYYPSHDAWNSRFRQIRVQVNRRGAEVRHRRGYVASPLPPRNAQTREAELAAALQNPLESTAMGLTVRLGRADGAAGSMMVTTRIDPRGVTLQRSGDRWTGQADLLVAQASPGGALDISVDTTLTLNLTDEQRDRVLREGLVVSRSIVLHWSTHQLRVVSRDIPTGATGSLVIPSDKLRAVLAR